jgi:archaellum component FlaF (FlaF/FlaG flagellin family)
MKNIILKYIFTFSLLYTSAFASTLTSLNLESNDTTVNKAETVQLSVVGTYSDNSTKTVDANVVNRGVKLGSFS